MRFRTKTQLKSPVFFAESIALKSVPISLLVIDDDELIAVALSALCERIPGIQVLGRATSGKDGLILMEQMAPQLALVDLLMPRLSGIDVVKAARQQRLRTRSIILTGNPDQEWCALALRAGVAGYMLKRADRNNFRWHYTPSRLAKSMSRRISIDALDQPSVRSECERDLTPQCFV